MKKTDAPLLAATLTGFLRLEQVLQLIPVSKATWWNGCRTGRFPKPYKLAPRVTAWKVTDIQTLLERFEPTSQNH
jgi:predicted DNA-binding transcriptional regulator AlpA